MTLTRPARMILISLAWHALAFALVVLLWGTAADQTCPAPCDAPVSNVLAVAVLTVPALSISLVTALALIAGQVNAARQHGTPLKSDLRTATTATLIGFLLGALALAVTIPLFL